MIIIAETETQSEDGWGRPVRVFNSRAFNVDCENESEACRRVRMHLAKENPRYRLNRMYKADIEEIS